ncbi:hypothetical protein [Sphingomonas sp. LT1P40]|uniref:hypothetical protein n=1 Tax=Alteristakelama amylovorans TaxID=3096166 RepID=UPI002FCBC190
MTDSPVHSVGLGGDGDEIWAIEEVETAFGVKLDDKDAIGWVTAGDVFRSLHKALPSVEMGTPEEWNRFATALARQTGIDPELITPESPLLGETRIWRVLAWMPAAILLAPIAMLVAAVAAYDG